MSKPAQTMAINLLFRKLRTALEIRLKLGHASVVVYTGEYGRVETRGSAKYRDPHILVISNAAVLEDIYEILEEVGKFEFDDPPLTPANKEGVSTLKIYT